MRPVDIGADAVQALKRPGLGRVSAVFARALYIQAPGGLVALTTTQAPRGPLHIRVARLPVVARGSPVTVDQASLQIGAHRYPLDAPMWSPRLPDVSTLATARQMARRWLLDPITTLDIGSTRPSGLPAGAIEALSRGELREFTEMVGGRGPGLTPAGDDVLAGVLLVARAICGGTATPPDALLRCAHLVPTNDVARAFLACAARGRCIEPAHSLLTGLADADHPTVCTAVTDLRRFGSSSGPALMYGIRTALLALPNPAPSWASIADLRTMTYQPATNVPWR